MSPGHFLIPCVAFVASGGAASAGMVAAAIVVEVGAAPAAPAAEVVLHALSGHLVPTGHG